MSVRRHFYNRLNIIILYALNTVGYCPALGPISSVLANRYGCRTVTIIGSVVASAGFVASTFSPNIYVMILTYGVIAGIVPYTLNI